MDVRIITKNNNPWFVLIDVCKILKIKNPSTISFKLDEDEKDYAIINTTGGTQTAIIVNKSGLYSLILRSRKPGAKQFKKWVTFWVLPLFDHKPISEHKNIKNNSPTIQHSMNNTKKELIIANTAIRQDSEGRYCLNDCHRASGFGSSKEPNQWLRYSQAKELINEIEVTANSQAPVNIVKTGLNKHRGIYVAKELVYAYAMWISPSFNIQVIRAYDDLVEGKYQPTVDFNDPAFLRSTLLTYTEKCIQLENENKELKPKADALDLIATSKGPMCISNAAKHLQIRPTDLFNYLSSNKWIITLCPV